MEPILNPENARFTIYPIQYPGIWDLYMQQLSAFWKAQEIDFSRDRHDFEELNEGEQHFIKRVLAFFAASDGIVNFNISERFMKDVQITEARVAYTFQMAMENIHGETYSLMLDNIVNESNEKKYLFNAIQTIPSIKQMSEWAMKWIDSDTSFAHRLIAFAVVEGIFFSGAFASIYWLKKHKGSGRVFMNGLVKSNEFIARDEGLHTIFACEMYKLLQNRLPMDEVLSIIIEGVMIAKEFMSDALPIRLIGMNVDQMNTYIEYVADVLLVNLGYTKHYNVQNPFRFMDMIGVLQKTNFFESRPTEYMAAHTANNTHNTFALSDDF
jgi:ribonucleotide reductase beta subunit family protein with ferritin-like domain